MTSRGNGPGRLRNARMRGAPLLLWSWWNLPIWTVDVYSYSHTYIYIFNINLYTYWHWYGWDACEYPELQRPKLQGAARFNDVTDTVFGVRRISIYFPCTHAAILLCLGPCYTINIRVEDGELKIKRVSYGETTISTIRTKIAADKESKNQIESNK